MGFDFDFEFEFGFDFFFVYFLLFFLESLKLAVFFWFLVFGLLGGRGVFGLLFLAGGEESLVFYLFSLFYLGLYIEENKRTDVSCER